MNQLLKGYKEQIHDWISDLHFSQIQRRSLLIVVAVVCVLSAGVVFRGHSQPIAMAEPLIIAPPNITVDVAGGVNLPGVYSLPANSRVIDALKIAGNAKPGMDMSDLNLARIIKDGEQIYVAPNLPTAISRSIATTVIKKLTGPININRATLAQFDLLPGIGPVIAARIVTYRKVNGPFSVIEDLQKVSGIGSAKFAQLKSKVRV